MAGSSMAGMLRAGARSALRLLGHPAAPAVGCAALLAAGVIAPGTVGALLCWALLGVAGGYSLSGSV